MSAMKVLRIQYDQTVSGTLRATSPDLNLFEVLSHDPENMPDQIKTAIEGLFAARGEPVEAVQAETIASDAPDSWILLPAAS